MNIYKMARQRMAGVDFIATRSHDAEVALAHKAEYNRKWREANPDKVEAMRMKEREREKTPERKAMHKAWAQSEAGKLSMRKRGKKYYNTPKGKANALKKARRYYEAHKNDPAWKAHRRELQRAWRKKNRDKVAQINARYRAKKEAA